MIQHLPSPLQRNDFGVCSFSVPTFVGIVKQASRAVWTNPPDQVVYVAKYADTLGARTIVRESRYVDRHYMDEYALYYSRMLVPPPSTVERLHLFAAPFNQENLDGWFQASLASQDAVARTYLPKYLGFVCVRPIESVPIGRTVLEQLPDGDTKQRYIWATSDYKAHLANLEVSVQGLAFQQQDVAVGACATAALWSALSRVARQDGMRAPTPAEIAELAGRPARAFHPAPLAPSAGLTLPQLCDVTRACGFAPELIDAHERPELFAVALYTFLRSGIPVVLSLRGEGRGHAVTASGFHRSTSEYPLLSTTVRSRSSRLRKIYVHDDRLGPYARAILEPIPPNEIGEGLTLQIPRLDGDDEDWLVEGAMVPLYPKLRLRSLLPLGLTTSGLVEDMVGEDRAHRLTVEFFYVRAGELLRALAGAVDPLGGAALVKMVSLSRWCGVVRWYLDDDELVDFVFDTTDVVRGDGLSLLRAIVTRKRAFIANVRVLAAELSVPFA